jgi:ubiquinone/menaquinone biosynthesis C-methylase UbiE
MLKHNEIVRHSFTERAESYAKSPWVTDEERIARLVAAAQPKRDDRVLDVACGPGHIAEAFSHVCREVIGVDLTEAPLAIADERRRTREITNLSFRACDVQHLPFGGEEFDIVACRLGMHHFEHPLKVLTEMARVCRVGGSVVVEDIVASEHPERAAFLEHCEAIRVPAHARFLPLSELLLLFRDAGIETHTVTTGEVVPEVERWLAKTPFDRAAEIRRLFEEDRIGDLSGLQPYLDEHGRLFFHQHLAVVAGRKLHDEQRGLQHRKA